MTATKASVLARIKEYDQIGKEQFLKRYASGRSAKSYYLIYNSKYYDLKAIYAASKNPPTKPSEKNSRDSKYELEELGYVCIIDKDEDKKEYNEGERRLTEVQILTRNKGLVAAAKEKYKSICRACDFDFSKFYGEIGIGFIECHHLNPISKVTPKSPPVTVDEVTVLCSNCHRMVHTSSPPLTVEALKALIAAAKISN
ncbi:MAG TPA: hypothetical protein VGU70_16120 [Methylobacterium sp.]|jgi:hypothetical protein|uniref:HNH endonuclease n=1 Tax=Methylorubrum sp. B1-46 TaxID=2897334 RepID=UPI001E49DBE4|nr:hypothetical protein [Methylorubrum sp. B1-46]UGB27378.1 hypothetical protein LPC10_07375 [Methylorubrum sp. B1-46]HEV2544282.1 hypothetical protein [Methylobacterium sp.]